MGGMSGRVTEHRPKARPASVPTADAPAQRAAAPGPAPRHWSGIADTPIQHSGHIGNPASLDRGGLSRDALPPMRASRDSVVQRQLTPVPNANHFTDTRDNTNRRFTPDAGNAGLTGTYTCQDQYRYHYDDGTKQYRVLGAPAGTYWDVQNQREQRHVATAADANGRSLHRYESGNGNVRHYYHAGTGSYRPMPQRAHWIDTNGRFVDNAQNGRRVLTPDGRGVDKQYGVAKHGRSFVVPYKPTNAFFLPGLPNIHGGNIDPHETAPQALARELREETGNRYAVAGNQGVLLQHQDPPNPHNPNLDPNRYTVDSIDVTPQVNAPVPRQEMEGEFSFTASDFIGHTASVDATKARLLHLFRQDRAGDQAHSQFLANRTQAQLNDWRGSHAMQALAGKVRADAQEHEQGLGDARAGNGLPQVPSAERALGHQLYGQGATAARSGAVDPQQTEPAYRVGSQDYLDGLAAAKANTQALAHVAHTQARADYDEGIARARRGEGPEANVAGLDAHAHYELGRQHGQRGEDAEHGTPAYLAGHGEAIREFAQASEAKRRNVDD